MNVCLDLASSIYVKANGLGDSALFAQKLEISLALLVSEFESIFNLVVGEFAFAEKATFNADIVNAGNINTIVSQHLGDRLNAFISGIRDLDQRDILSFLGIHFLKVIHELRLQTAILFVDDEDQLLFVALIGRRNLITFAMELLCDLVCDFLRIASVAIQKYL